MTLIKSIRSVGSCVAALCLAMAVPAAAQSSKPAGKVVMATYGGGVGDAWRSAFGAPFTKETGIPATLVDVPNTRAPIISAKGNPEYNALLMTYFEAAELDAMGLLENFTPEELPGLKDIPERLWSKNAAGKALGAATYFLYFGIAYNTTLAKAQDFDSWKNLADPKWKDKITINRPTYGASYELTIFSKAAGGDESNVAAGLDLFRKVSANALTAYSSLGHMNQLLSRGEVAAGPFYSGRVWALRKDGAPVDIVIPREGGLLLPYVVVIPKGAKNIEAAKSFLNYTMRADRQLEAFRTTGYIPLNAKAELSAADIERIGMPLDELQRKLYAPDWVVVAKHYTERVKQIEQIQATAKQ